MNYETNSQNIQTGDVFVALKGEYYDGHDYIIKALDKGASLAVGEQKLKLKNYKCVKNSYNYLIKKVSKENKKLTKDLTLIGITGTKGKSTTAMLIYQMLSLLKVKCAYIGTLGLYYNDKIIKLNNTTPDIVTLNKIFKLLKENNITHVVMEVSSHSLALKRIKGLSFKVAAFTNLSQDHLDFHHILKIFKRTYYS